MYEVYVWYGELMELVGKTKSLDRAGLTAQAQSLVDCVSEVLIYNEQGALVEVWVDGNEVDLQEYMDKDFEQDYDDEVNEIGYNPYTGGLDMDL